MYFEETDKPKPPSKLTHTVLSAPTLEAHRQISKVEDENVGVEAAHKSEQAAEAGVRVVNSIHRNRKLKPYRTTAALEKKADQANINALYQKALHDSPELHSNPLSRWQQKQAIKRQYAAAKKARQTAGTTKRTAERAAKTAKKAAEAAEKTAAFVARNWKPILIIAAIAILLVLIMNAVSSCSMLLQGGMNMVIGTSYAAEDEDILAAEAYYTGLESGLRQKIGKIETTHPGYDEYCYNLAEIGHDPFELISYLTALYEDFTIAEARPALDVLFDRQYTLTLTETVEIRYRTETRTETWTETDPETGETTTYTDTYEVQVPYDYHILTVTLTNNALLPTRGRKDMSDNPETKMIRFIDSQYHTLFYVPDGGNVVLTYSDGEKLIRACKFLDKYHTLIGSNVYHICEFAEKMERNGTVYTPEQPPALPDLCYSTLPSSGELIMIERGKKGYAKCGFSTPNPEQNKMTADRLNSRAGVTRQQEAAMAGGSMFGWNAPAAKTSSYDVRGNPIKPVKTRAARNKGMER